MSKRYNTIMAGLYIPIFIAKVAVVVMSMTGIIILTSACLKPNK